MYLDVLWTLNFIVDLLLLIATNRLSGYPTVIVRVVFSAVLGGFYGSVCVLPGWSFLARTPWRLVFLLSMGWIAFGLTKDSLRRSVLFVLLSMALGGIALGMGRSGFLPTLLSAASVCFLTIFGLRGKYGNRFIPVKIIYNGKCHHFTAMIDTGNTLTDPITGEKVLVVSSGVGKRLLGLQPTTFADPIKAMEYIQGGRLVPFHTIGNEGGMLVAKRFQDVTIGKWHGNCLIAFATQELGRGEAYEALAGGII